MKILILLLILAGSSLGIQAKEKFKQKDYVNLLNIEAGYTASPEGYFFPT